MFRIFQNKISFNMYNSQNINNILFNHEIETIIFLTQFIPFFITTFKSLNQS